MAAVVTETPIEDLFLQYQRSKRLEKHYSEVNALLTAGTALTGEPIENVFALYQQSKRIEYNYAQVNAGLTCAALVACGSAENPGFTPEVFKENDTRSRNGIATLAAIMTLTAERG